jgi:ribosomal protein S18 acetylase RimI-like enzyme
MYTLDRLRFNDERRTLPRTLRRTAGKALRFAFTTNSAYYFERKLASPVPEIVPRIPVTVEFDAPAETLRWIRWNGEPWMLYDDEVDIGFREHHLFPNIKHEGKIIGYLKVARKNVYIHEYRRTVALPDDNVFIYDAYVSPEYRGLKTARYMVAETLDRLKAAGLSSIGCHIPPWNRSSLNLFVSLGFTRTRYVRYINMLGMPFFISRYEGNNI